MLDETDPSHTALGKTNKDSTLIELVKPKKISGIKARNREQIFVMDALLDEDIAACILTGRTGSGKTIMTLAAALHFVEHNHYDKIILSRPMSQIGKHKLGTLPGTSEEKLNPYLSNYTTNLEQFVGSREVQNLITGYKLEFIPIQLMRGASFNNCFIIIDEVQDLTREDILAIGTRTGENSKIVLMGDLAQRDEKIAKDKTGLHKVINSPVSKESPLFACIELRKCERSETARKFAEIFDE